MYIIYIYIYILFCLFYYFFSVLSYIRKLLLATQKLCTNDPADSEPWKRNTAEWFLSNFPAVVQRPAYIWGKQSGLFLSVSYK